LRALVLLTRLPVPGADGARAAASAWAWPAVGVILGGLAGALAWAALHGRPAIRDRGGTGAGCGDRDDGRAARGRAGRLRRRFLGRSEPERRLEIMKDSRIGAYGVLALILVIGSEMAGP
jgi:adenosylcobinamide-GDP ribazoletransferase